LGLALDNGLWTLDFDVCTLNFKSLLLPGTGLFMMICLSGCTTTTPRPSLFAQRTGDEIVVAGQFVHTGTPVVLWMDPGGYDAYRVERRFGPVEKSSWEETRDEGKGPTTPARYGLRQEGLTEEEVERVRGGGWDLPTLQRIVDQFVIHYDAAGTSRQCFKVLHDLRGLSVHFMLDLDGTIYQTLDLKERAWHATGANSRSVGVEIANIGAFPTNSTNSLAEWYTNDASGQTVVRIPAEFGDGGLRTKPFVARPARQDPVTGAIQGQELMQFDFTPEQYQALIHLTATLTRVFPKIKCEFPRDASGALVKQKMSDAELANYHGVLGHYHIQTHKFDPGPAFQLNYVIGEALRFVHESSPPRVEVPSKGNMRPVF
jgi:N-acetyl-anhydromuramyl-L-alanine amidase AmpD